MGHDSLCFAGQYNPPKNREPSFRHESGTENRVFEGHSFTVKAVCFSPDDSCVLSGSWDHTARVWSVSSGKELYKLESLTGRFSAVAFHDDARQIAAGDSDKLIHLVRIA